MEGKKLSYYSVRKQNATSTLKLFTGLFKKKTWLLEGLKILILQFVWRQQ